jgi:hypothetical protein
MTDAPAPKQPKKLEVTKAGRTHKAIWGAASGADIAGYEVEVRTTSQVMLTRVDDATELPLPKWKDIDEAELRVRSVDKAGNVSEWVEMK